MAIVTAAQIVNAPLGDVWASWDDFGGVHRFNPNLSGSFLLEGSEQTGLGATRQCDLIDGKNYIQERVVEYVPNKRITVDIVDGTVPIRNGRAEIKLTAHDESSTRVEMIMHFEPKMGPLGQLMVPLMKPQFRKMLKKLLEGNAAYVEKSNWMAA
jgi:ribosome-associated toxin RatA of RatAB toxin-antitoxin module